MVDWHWCLKRLVQIALLEVGLFARKAMSSTYCWYRHKNYDTMRQVYCENGCCSDHGDHEDICCFNWSIGIIIGIVLGGLAVLTAIVVFIICCYSAKRKRKNRTGSIISTRPSNSVVYTASAGYVIPHPPSAFYPSSQFPNAAPAVPPTFEDDKSYTSTQSKIDNFQYSSSHMNGVIS